MEATILDNALHGRFKDAPWYSKASKSDVLVGGAGGIGSWTTFLLARAGFNPIVYDFDSIEEHNLGGQLYSIANIESLKVDALFHIIENFCDTQISIFDQRVDSNTITNKIVIAAFDNIKARKIMFEKWQSTYGDDPEAIFIDGRLEAEYFKIFCIRGLDTDRSLDYYKSHLPEDNTIPDGPCTFKQTSHTAAMIASHIVAFLTNHITNIVSNDTTRSVPYMYEYFIPMGMAIETITNS